MAAGLFVAAVLTACTVQLAPNYDPSIVDGISAASEDAEKLFASVSMGVSAATFAKREDDYNAIIGKLEALRISAESRPAASGSLFLQRHAIKGIPTLATPTPSVLAEAGKPIAMMRDSDRKRGLTPLLVEGFKNSFEISIQQALTYEKALQR
jgi:hypothetical protein